MKRSGFSLVEAIMGIFLLIGAFLVLAALFHSGLNYLTRIEARNLAVMLAERKMEEMRAHAQTRTGQYGYFDWSAYTGALTPDPDYPSYQVAADVVDVSVFSPSSEFESAYPSDQRVMRASLKQARVRVVWSQGANQLKLVSYIGDPAATARPTRRFRNTNPIVVQATSAWPTLLLRDQPLGFQATGYDQFNQAIDDLFFDWYIEPGLSNATMSQTRDGRTGTLTNVIIIPTTPPVSVYTGGQVVVVARAVYRGQEAFGQSAPVPLEP